MNLLLDICPQSVEIEGLQIPISSDFRVSILFEIAMQDRELSDMEKLQIVLDLYFPDTYIPDT